VSKRAEEFKSFSDEVLDHIDKYTVPQYGDMPNDQVSGMSTADLVTQIKRYCNRFGNNQRGDVEQLRDFMKMAHYAGMAYYKYKESLNRK